nr:hypothetical protein [Abalone asfa-like virus]
MTRLKCLVSIACSALSWFEFALDKPAPLNHVNLDALLFASPSQKFYHADEILANNQTSWYVFFPKIAKTKILYIFGKQNGTISQISGTCSLSAISSCDNVTIPNNLLPMNKRTMLPTRRLSLPMIQKSTLPSLIKTAFIDKYKLLAVFCKCTYYNAPSQVEIARLCNRNGFYKVVLPTRSARHTEMSLDYMTNG